ncbi:hypothetical protein CG719_28110 [Streptomyces sp. CB01373]|nr:hypothetical protein CG719_28110 [Streptomyces sp. CB01373]
MSNFRSSVSLHSSGSGVGEADGEEVTVADGVGLGESVADSSSEGVDSDGVDSASSVGVDSDGVDSVSSVGVDSDGVDSVSSVGVDSDEVTGSLPVAKAAGAARSTAGAMAAVAAARAKERRIFMRTSKNRSGRCVRKGDRRGR